MKSSQDTVVPSSYDTRAQALEAFEAALPRAEASALSPTRAAVETFLLLAAGGLLGGAVRAGGHGDLAVALVLLVLTLAASGGLARLLSAGRRCSRELQAWLAVEVETRALPGAVSTVLRAPYDARSHEDFYRVAATALGLERVKPFGLRLALRTAFASVILVIGLVTAIAGGLDLADGEDSVSAASLIVTGAVYLVAGLAVAWWGTAYGWRSTQRWNRMGAERDLWSAQRELAGLDVERNPIMSRSRRALTWSALAVLPVFFSASAIFRAGPAGVIVVAVLVLGLAAVVLAPRLRRRSADRRLRGGTDPGCVVDGPDGLAVLNAGSTGLLLGGRPLPAVLGATRGYQGRPFAELEVHLLQADEAVTLVKTYDRTGLDQVLAEAGVRRLG